MTEPNQVAINSNQLEAVFSVLKFVCSGPDHAMALLVSCLYELNFNPSINQNHSGVTIDSLTEEIRHILKQYHTNLRETIQ